jgi:hypothetical protein
VARFHEAEEIHRRALADAVRRHILRAAAQFRPRRDERPGQLVDGCWHLADIGAGGMVEADIGAERLDRDFDAGVDAVIGDVGLCLAYQLADFLQAESGTGVGERQAVLDRVGEQVDMRLAALAALRSVQERFPRIAAVVVDEVSDQPDCLPCALDAHAQRVRHR